MKQLKDVITKIYENEELRSTCIPLFLSNPGMGKTTAIKEFAKEKGVKCLTEITSTKMPHEFSGIAIPNHETKRMTYFDYDAILDLKDGDILFLDELLNANPMILNAFLTVLEDRVLPSGKRLAKIMIIAAGNPQGAVSLTPQIKERFIWYDIKFDKESWKRYMSKYLITDDIFEQLCVLIQNESFTSSEKNFYTPRSIEKAMKMMINDIPTPYEAKLSPILNLLINNSSGQDFQIGDYTWKANESIHWLKLQKLKLNEANTK
jgi:hypothetical protein